MEIKVETRSKEKREFIEAVSRLFAKNLKIDKSKYTLIISSVSNLIKINNMRGSACMLGPKFISIQLDSKLRFDDLISTLAHEMIHAKQYIKGQFKIKITKAGKSNFYWCGKKYNTNYFDSPWEIEAFSRERILANKVAQIVLN